MDITPLWVSDVSFHSLEGSRHSMRYKFSNGTYSVQTRHSTDALKQLLITKRPHVTTADNSLFVHCYVRMAYVDKQCSAAKTAGLSIWPYWMLFTRSEITALFNEKVMSIYPPQMLNWLSVYTHIVLNQLCFTRVTQPETMLISVRTMLLSRNWLILEYTMFSRILHALARFSVLLVSLANLKVV